jgi:hypothetical protein
MTTLAPATRFTRRSESLSVETNTKPCAEGIFEYSQVAATRHSVAKCAFGLREKITQKFDEPRGQALVEQQLHLGTAGVPAVKSAAYA